MYNRKTKDVWVLQGNYGYGWDDLTYEDSRADAQAQRKCYNENETTGRHRIIKRREAITQ